MPASLQRFERRTLPLLASGFHDTACKKRLAPWLLPWLLHHAVHVSGHSGFLLGRHTFWAFFDPLAATPPFSMNVAHDCIAIYHIDGLLPMRFVPPQRHGQLT